jgi:hypothetical protein
MYLYVIELYAQRMWLQTFYSAVTCFLADVHISGPINAVFSPVSEQTHGRVHYSISQTDKKHT